jgi:hypothetical protein
LPQIAQRITGGRPHALIRINEYAVPFISHYFCHAGQQPFVTVISFACSPSPQTMMERMEKIVPSPFPGKVIHRQALSSIFIESEQENREAAL